MDCCTLKKTRQNNDMEQTEEKKTYDTKYKLFLSEQDEYVPSTHLGMYSLFRNPNNKSVYMSEARCQAIRYKTYNSVMDLYRKYKSLSYCTFFNYNTDILTKLGVNYFETHDKFAPIAELVEAFPEKIEKDDFTGTAISFGIDKITLKTYLNCLRKGTDFWGDPPIAVMKRKKLQAKNRDFIMFGSDDTKIDYWKSIHMPRNPLYSQFLDWCELQELRPYEGMLMAIELLLNAHPADGLKDVTEYDYIDELDIPLYAKTRKRSKKINCEVSLSSQIYALAEQIIERYNRDPKNIAHRIDFDLYCNNALHILNQNMDLQYRDPTIYEEKVMTDEIETYNNSILKDL